MRQSFLVTILGLMAANLLAASELSWDKTEVDLEMKPGQEEIRAIFKVTNKGKDRIRIARVKTSCGCTGSIIDRKILKPGKSTEIIATFNKGKRQGLNRNRLEVFIDSEPGPVATLRMNVQIPKLIEAKPQIVYWNETTPKTEREVVLTLDERYVDVITEVNYDHDKLNVTMVKDPKGEASRILRIIPQSFDYVYRGTITVKTEGKGNLTGEARIMTLVQP